MKRKNIRWLLFWYNIKYPRDWIIALYSRMRCKIFGHPKPYSQKISCDICPRCSKIMLYKKVQTKFTVRREVSDPSLAKFTTNCGGEE